MSDKKVFLHALPYQAVLYVFQRSSRWHSELCTSKYLLQTSL